MVRVKEVESVMVNVVVSVRVMHESACTCARGAQCRGGSARPRLGVCCSSLLQQGAPAITHDHGDWELIECVDSRPSSSYSVP